jgi:peptidoglycan/xylan/chitin deacetylase (PgdA/CDA1 family)
LEHGYSFYSLDDLYNSSGFIQTNKKFVVYTFDDGYAGCLKYGAPIFEKYQIPYSIYICTQMIENKLVLWWYLLEEIILNNSVISFESNNLKYRYECTTLKEKFNSFFKIRELIIEAGQDYKETLLTDIFSGYTNDYFALCKKYSLTWDEIKMMSESKLVTFGAHTINHYNLVRLSPMDAHREILLSKEILEQKIGREVNHFAYPFGGIGQVSEREIEMVERAGFRTAVTSLEGNYFEKHRKETYALPRLIIYKATIEELDYKVNGGYVLSNMFFRKNTYSE